MNIATWPKPNAPSSDPEDLPTALANIPETSPEANDLAFVPGTDRAKDAVMDSAIPQTEAPPPPSRPTPPSPLRRRGSRLHKRPRPNARRYAPNHAMEIRYRQSATRGIVER